VPSAQVQIVDGGHFSLDTAANETAPRVSEFMDIKSKRRKSWQQRPSLLLPFGCHYYRQTRISSVFDFVDEKPTYQD
jgi:hypothetical protein